MLYKTNFLKLILLLIWNLCGSERQLNWEELKAKNITSLLWNCILHYFYYLDIFCIFCSLFAFFGVYIYLHSSARGTTRECEILPSSVLRCYLKCIRKARRIIKDSSHPSHRLLSLLPSGRRLRSIRSRTSRLRDSFFPQAIRLMNSQN